MRARFIRSGSDSFADHELLELLLFYAIPRENTNGMAHDLIERFGSICGVASAQIDELMLVDGVGERAAVLIKLAMTFAKRCAFEEIGSTRKLDSLEKIVQYGKSLFIGSNTETVYLLLFDNAFSLIDCSCVAFGSINEVRPIVRVIIERSITKKASSALLLHNHPGGIAEPSDNDIHFSNLVDHELDILGIYLVEHVIIAADGFFPIMKSSRNGKNLSDIPKLNDFYEKS